MATDRTDVLSYKEIMRQFSRPTEVQTSLFANYITSAHSWYKHLPLYPKAPFFCYLDPQAGQVQSYDSATGAVAFRDTDGKEIPHYTAQSTVMYRQRFGLWNYHNGCHPTMGIVTPKGYTCASRSTASQVIPPELRESGKALLSALIHPHINLSIWTGGDFYGLPNPLSETVSDFPVPPDSHQRKWELLKRLWALLNQESLSPTEELYTKEEIQTVTDKLSSFHFWRNNDEELLTFTKKIGLSEDKVGLVIRACFADQTWETWIRAFSDEIGAIELPPHLESLVSLIVREKIRQFDALEMAMRRFLRAVYE